MRIVIALLIISILGNLFGLFILYKFMKKQKYVDELQHNLAVQNGLLNDLAANLPRQMLFLHHSVGRNWLNEGGLRDTLLSLGIGIRGATYGDDIGQETDICHWAPKFRQDMKKIFKFKAHPNQYFNGDRENDIIMFKSCFPNSDIVGDGVEPGDPAGGEKTLANYRATFAALKEEFSGYPDKLFIYVTSPPLVPSETTADRAGRARQFTDWISGEFASEYKQVTGLNNLLVFNLFDVLADDGDYLRAEYRRSEHDSHPNAAGSKAATEKFLAFLREHQVL